MSIWYATREDIKGALDSKETARNNAQIDRAIESASRGVEALCHRRFYPEQATKHFNWPDGQRARPWRLWLNDSEVISVTSLSSGGTPISAADYFLEPNTSGPPYNRIEIDLASSAAFGGGDTHQRDVTVTGLFGYRDDETSVGTLAAAVASTTAGTVAVSGAASAVLGVGSVLRVDSERLLVTGRSMADTGQNLAADIDQQMKTTAVPVTDGTTFAVGEVILIDSERMLIVDIAANTLIVKRAWDGFPNAAHTSGTDIYAARSLTVIRGALGTTAATHDSGATVRRWDPPSPVRALTIGEALNTLTLEQAGYSLVLRSGETGSERNRDQRGLNALREQVYASHGRKARIRGV
ncbi:hypothetical protein [Streptomyces sp. NPDC096153]|uniref:hypothetical protein n=1 Tax=Streptomyces sp. NPDC096153 TaxID=3155548 RepID=UPI003328E8E4